MNETRGGEAVASGDAEAEHVFDLFIDSYVEACHGRVDGFVDRHFSFRGTLRIHRAALGLDLLRAPANLFLAVPHLIKAAATFLAGRIGAAGLTASVERLPTQFRTDVEREVERLVRIELLGAGDAGRAVRAVLGERDAAADGSGDEGAAESPLAAASVRLCETFDTHRGEVVGAGLAADLAHYVSARTPAAEITTACISAAAGLVLLHQLTPTAFSLGPSLAALQARQAAIDAFPLGAAMGRVWQAAFPVDASLSMVFAMTVALLVAMSLLAAFAGVVADPVQRLLGIHHRRLRRLVEAANVALRESGAGGFRDRTHYVARMFDILETLRLAVRAVT